MSAFNSERIHQAANIFRQQWKVVRRQGRLATAVTSLVPPNYAILVDQRRQLIVPHSIICRETITQNDREAVRRTVDPDLNIYAVRPNSGHQTGRSPCTVVRCMWRVNVLSSYACAKCIVQRLSCNTTSPGRHLCLWTKASHWQCSQLRHQRLALVAQADNVLHQLATQVSALRPVSGCVRTSGGHIQQAVTLFVAQAKDS